MSDKIAKMPRAWFRANNMASAIGAILLTAAKQAADEVYTIAQGRP